MADLNPKEKKAEKAVQALKAAGLEFVRRQGEHVLMPPATALQMLLLTDDDAQRVFTAEQKIRAGVKREVEALQGKMARLVKLASHSPDLCKKGEHITDSWATGGRSGHCVTSCLVCDYRQDGYD